MKTSTLDYCYNWLLERQLFTEEELELITNMYGYDINTLDLAVYARFGYQAVQDLIDDSIL